MHSLKELLKDVLYLKKKENDPENWSQMPEGILTKETANK